MPAREIDEQLTKYLTDVHAIEEQALTQLRAASKIAKDESLARIYERHLAETEEQERRVRAALEERDASPAKSKDLAGKAGGLAMLAFATVQTDTPGKLTAHAYSYEHMELAAYELLKGVARKAGADDVVELAEEIGGQEAAMADRLAGSFDTAVEASLREASGDEVGKHLEHYLADAHALEQQGLQLLSDAPKLLTDHEELADVFESHLEQTRGHEERIRERLEARGSSPSKVKDAALRVGGLNVGGFFGAQPDTPAKLVGFAFAFEHVEVAGYELLKRVASRAEDGETVNVAEDILGEERAQGERIRSQFDAAVDAALADQGVRA